MAETVDLTNKQTKFKDLVKSKIPNQGNLDLCLTCGACASGCPATGLEGLDPRKFLRMVLLGMDEEVKETPWIWMCSMCQRCIRACPMGINISGLVLKSREAWNREETPKGIQKSCDLHLTTGNSTGIPKDDWLFLIDDMIEELHEEEPEWADVKAPMDKKGAMYYFNQNAKEPTVEPEEMLPSWKIFHEVGIDWTYSSEFWDGTNYCMFTGNDKDWEYTVRRQVEIVNDLGCKYFINTE